MEIKTTMRNVGRFFVDQSFFDENDLTFQEKLNIFSRILVIECKSNFVNKTLEYYGVSPDFRVLNAGEIIPVYQCILTRNDESSPIEFSWMEVKQG